MFFHYPFSLSSSIDPASASAAKKSLVSSELPDLTSRIFLSLLQVAYPALLQRLNAKLFKALAADVDDLETLHERAKVVKGLSGDFRLESFAGRLLEFDGTDEAMEGLVSLAVNLPTSDWSDTTPDAAELALADMALKFRHVEMLAAIKERTPTRHAIPPGSM